MMNWLPARRSEKGTIQARQILFASLLGLGASLGIAAAALVMRWQSDRAVGSDARLLLRRDAQQIQEAVRSWRRGILLFQEALDRAPDLTQSEKMALADSALEHTPQWVGIGWVDGARSVRWWIPPPFHPLERESLVRQAQKKVWFRNLAGLPSSVTFFSKDDRPYLAMLQPLRTFENQPAKLIGLFDLHSLMSGVAPGEAIRLSERGAVLYQSKGWQESDVPKRALLKQSLGQEGSWWVLERQQRTGPMIPAFWFNLLLALAVLLTAAALGGMFQATEQLRRLATTDELTGLHNRRFFLERLKGEMERARRYKRELACLMIDLVGFKRINDLMGHSTGDRALKKVASELKRSLRQSDIVARFGGDEFVAALPETSPQETAAVAEKLRRVSIKGLFVPVRLSVGIAQMQAGDAAHDMIQRADESLYAGRNGGEPPTPIHFPDEPTVAYR